MTQLPLPAGITRLFARTARCRNSSIIVAGLTLIRVDFDRKEQISDSLAGHVVTAD